jgi:predicted Zn-dependent peptidase
MSKEAEYQIHQLANGIRLVHKHSDASVAHLGVIIQAGARDETADKYGLAHFIEHIIFKGTSKRKSYHVLSRMENVGGDLNAYTTKEETAIYASFMPEYYGRAAELFADILLNSQFPSKELEKEKDVIRDEIQSYLDSPSEQIFDDIEDLVFGQHPLGHPILGTVESLESLGRQDINDFLSRYYRGPSIVISSVGSINFDKLIRVIGRYFSAMPDGSPVQRTKVIPDYHPIVNRQERNTYQNHCMLANLAPSAENSLRLPMILLNNILGGPGMNTRLNMGIREKYGFCYNIESHYTPYSDTGIFSVYFGVEHSFAGRTHDLVMKELARLRLNSLGSVQLHTAKKQLIGQLAITFESNLAEMLSMGKSMHLYGQIDDFATIYRRIESINSLELLEAANLVFEPDNLSSLTYTNAKNL